MLEFLALNLGTIIIGLLILVGVVGAVISIIRNKKKGKCIGCSGGCSSCPSHSNCNSH